MNPFEQHGIAHLSASSLNAFRSSQAYWIISYLAKIKDPSNIAIFAGQAAEDAVSHGLFNPTASIEECIDLAAKAYRHKTALGGYDPEDREAKLEEIVGREAEGRKKAFEGFVRNALTALRPYGTPTRPENNERQHRIEIMLEGIPVPVIGYKDFAFDGHGLDVDLKTTSRMPEDMSQEHQLQAAIYWKASGNRAQRFCYVTKSDHKVLELSADAAAAQIHTATQIAHIVMRMLSQSSDWREIAARYAPDYSNFRWGTLTRAYAKDVYGF